MDEATREEIVVADAVEADAWADMYGAAPAPMGLVTEEIAGARLLVAPRIPISMLNRVIGLGLSEDATAETIDRVLARLRAIGAQSPWIHVSPAARPATLVDALVERGYAPTPRPTWAKVLRGREEPPEIATSLEVRDVGRDRAAELAAVLVAAHGMPPPVAPWIEALVGRPGWRAFAAVDAGRVVSGAFLFQRGDRAWLGMGGTLPSHRNRGAQGALMVRRIREAIAAGARHIVTETGEPVAGEPNPSLSNMYRCGFRKVASRMNYAPSAAVGAG